MIFDNENNQMRKKVINAPCYYSEALNSSWQTSHGKDISNPLMAGSLPKTIKPNGQRSRSTLEREEAVRSNWSENLQTKLREDLCYDSVPTKNNEDDKRRLEEAAFNICSSLSVQKSADGRKRKEGARQRKKRKDIKQSFLCSRVRQNRKLLEGGVGGVSRLSDLDMVEYLWVEAGGPLVEMRFCKGSLGKGLGGRLGVLGLVTLVCWMGWDSVT
ncbi:hypothetical protein Tco_1136256 [Tanacetum coccineum]